MNWKPQMTVKNALIEQLQGINAITMMPVKPEKDGGTLQLFVTHVKKN